MRTQIDSSGILVVDNSTLLGIRLNPDEVVFDITTKIQGTSFWGSGTTAPVDTEAGKLVVTDPTTNKLSASLLPSVVYEASDEMDAINWTINNQNQFAFTSH